MDQDTRKKINVITIGSCVSRFIGIEFVRDYNGYHLNHAQHLRSDQITQYYIDRTLPVPPMSIFDKYVEPDPKHDEFVRGMFRNMQPDHIGFDQLSLDEQAVRTPLLETLAKGKVDLIVLDNLPDLTSIPYLLFKDPDYPNSPINIPPWMCTNFRELNQNLRSSGTHLSATDSARNYVKIIDWIKTFQPDAHIGFICFPSCTSRRDAPQRAELAAAFHGELMVARGDRSFDVIPSWEIPDELTAPGDWTHFHRNYYQSIAGFLFMNSQFGALSND